MTDESEWHANSELTAFGTEAARVIGLRLRSKAATIRRLRPDIDRYLALGYSMRQLLDVLLASGLQDTSLGTLQSAVSRERVRHARSAGASDWKKSASVNP